jgi:hypothetical protein
VTTSTRWTSDWGMVLTSTIPLAVEPTERRPLTSTRVRTVPRLRRLSALIPAWPLLSSRRELDGRIDAASAGSWLTKSAMLLVGELFSISSSVRTWSGVGAWNPSRTTRVPVTTISSRLPDWAAVSVAPSSSPGADGWAEASASVADVSSWANAGPATDSAAKAAPENRNVFNELRRNI